MAERMTTEEVKAFMLDGSRTGKLATVRVDGSPHVAAVWFGFDDDDIVFLSGADSVKVANMRHDRRVTLFVDEERMPFAWARADCTVAELSEDPELLLHWATETCRRYVGDELAEQYGRRNAVPGELLVRLRPHRLVGYRGIAD